jgi:hypothetical protein
MLYGSSKNKYSNSLRMFEYFGLFYGKARDSLILVLCSSEHFSSEG